MSEEIKVRSSSGNIFADLGLANSSELLIKVELVRQISELITVRKLTQIEAAKCLESLAIKSLICCVANYLSFQAMPVPVLKRA